jgi:hypothetical protein
MSEPTVYECVSDQYDAWPGQHYTLQGFQRMCVACFGEGTELTRDGGDWKDETGQVVLREVQSSLPPGVPVVVIAGQMNPKPDPWGPWLVRMDDAALDWEDGRLNLKEGPGLSFREGNIERLTIDLTLESLKSLVRALEAAALKAECRPSSRLSPGNLCGNLCDYCTGEIIRPATFGEKEASIASFRDGGQGVIRVDGRSCYVEG